MRVLLAMSCVLAASAVSNATCQQGSDSVLTLADWSASLQDGGFDTVRLTLTLANSTAKGVRLVDGTVWFSDALGESIGGINIDRDIQIGAGEFATTESNMIGFERLTKIDHTDVRTEVAVCSIIYDDGTKQTFD